MGKVKTVDFSETIAACDLKVGRCRQLIIPPVYEVYRGYIVFAFSVCVCLCVNFFFCQRFLSNYCA